MQGRVAIITASSTGIGKAIATQLAEKGAVVIISSRNIDHVNQTVQELKEKGFQAFGIVCHVGKKEDRQKLINQTIERYGRIDYLVPNATVNLVIQGGYLKASQSQIQKMFDINYKSTFLLVQQTLPFLKKQKGSSIVFITTSLTYKPILQTAHYAITKLMVVAMAKVMSQLLMEDRIRVNCVSPGLIKTGFSKRVWGDQDKFKRQVAPTLGLGKRMGTADQVANAVRFLLSEEGSYINGEAIVIGGKPSARL